MGLVSRIWNLRKGLRLLDDQREAQPKPEGRTPTRPTFPGGSTTTQQVVSSTSEKIEVRRDATGTVISISVNGKNVDPGTPQGRSAVARAEKAQAAAEKAVQNAEAGMKRTFREMDRTFEQMSRDMDEAFGRKAPDKKKPEPPKKGK